MSNDALPKHIAIVMDGNGRWAKNRFLPRIAGHKAGVDAARSIVKACLEKQIDVLSLFAFSSENWRRPPSEVSALMDIFLSGLERELKKLHQNNIQVRFIGRRDRFSEKLQAKITEAEKLTQKNSGLVLIIAVDYGGQWDIVNATRQIAEQVASKTLSPDQIDDQAIQQYLSFSDLPNPDLFIRTSGEYRISNFMLWQLAYAELYFTEVFWPDFNEAELERALDHFTKRERRFGFCSEQLEGKSC